MNTLHTGSTAAEPRTEPRWRNVANGKRRQHLPRIAAVLAPVFGCKPRTFARWLEEWPERYATLIERLRQAGEHERVGRCLELLARARRHSAPAETNELLLELSQADADENVARDAYQLSRGAAERDTLLKRLRRQNAIGQAAVDAIEAAEPRS